VGPKGTIRPSPCKLLPVKEVPQLLGIRPEKSPTRPLAPSWLPELTKMLLGTDPSPDGAVILLEDDPCPDVAASSARVGEVATLNAVYQLRLTEGRRRINS
jgi:hypothetical protein